MIVYIAVNETKSGEMNILGAFTEENAAKRKLSEYAAENPEAECFLEQADTEAWQHETEETYRPVHRTRVHKATGTNSHVIVFTKEELPLVEESDEWYVICRHDNSFDKEEGLKKNLQVLEEYLAAEQTEKEEQRIEKYKPLAERLKEFYTMVRECNNMIWKATPGYEQFVVGPDYSWRWLLLFVTAARRRELGKNACFFDSSLEQDIQRFADCGLTMWLRRFPAELRERFQQTYASETAEELIDDYKRIREGRLDRFLVFDTENKWMKKAIEDMNLHHPLCILRRQGEGKIPEALLEMYEKVFFEMEGFESIGKLLDSQERSKYDTAMQKLYRLKKAAFRELPENLSDTSEEDREYIAKLWSVWIDGKKTEEIDGIDRGLYMLILMPTLWV